MNEHKILDAESMSYSEFRQKIKMQAYYIEQKNVRFTTDKNSAKTDCFNLEVMKELGIEFPYDEE